MISNVNHPHPKFCCDIIYSLPTKFGVGGWFYRDIIFSLPTKFGVGVNISWHYIFTPDKIWSGEGGVVVIILWHYIFNPGKIWIGVIILWHHIFTSGKIWGGGDHIVTLYLHSPQNLEWGGWLYRDIIFSLPAKYGVGGGGWLYRDIFSLRTKFGVEVIISWPYFHSQQNLGVGVIISWHHIFTPGKIWSGGDHIVTLYFHSRKFGVGVKISGFYNLSPFLSIYVFIFTPWNLGKLLYLSMISPLLLKLSMSDGYVMRWNQVNTVYEWKSLKSHM